jgi:hypothetical protein
MLHKRSEKTVGYFVCFDVALKVSSAGIMPSIKHLVALSTITVAKGRVQVYSGRLNAVETTLLSMSTLFTANAMMRDARRRFRCWNLLIASYALVAWHGMQCHSF